MMFHGVGTEFGINELSVLQVNVSWPSVYWKGCPSL